MANKPVMNVEDVEPMSFGEGRFGGEFRWVSQQIGAQKLGFNHVVIPPGNSSFPYHYHDGLEEGFFIIEGNGLLRYGGEEYPLRAGDAIACPIGSRSAHQITNNSDAELKYLAFSTKQSPEVAHYPDSNKIGIFSDPDPDAEPGSPPFRMLVMADAGVGYFEGEDLGDEKESTEGEDLGDENESTEGEESTRAEETTEDEE